MILLISAIIGAIGALGTGTSLLRRGRTNREMTRMQAHWKAEFQKSKGRPPIVLPASAPMGGLTMAQAAANLSTNMGVLSCPTGHANIVPVKVNDDETVAALCTDCDRQLPASWAPTAEETPL